MVHANNQTNERIPVVFLIMGSTRVGRVCPAVADWVAEIGRSSTGFAYEIIDLADWPLPMNDEPGMAALHPYTQSHTRAWSDKIKSSDAVVFVTPQYNWGYPAVLKNALDHLYHEWRGKPAAIVSYGGHGGGKCAEQLRQVAAGLKMRMVATSPALTLSEEVIRHGATLNPMQDFEPYVDSVKQAFDELTVQLTSASESEK